MRLSLRHIKKAACQGRSLQFFDLGSNFVAPRIQAAKPGHALSASTSFVQYLRRQPIGEHGTGEGARNPVAPVHRLGHRQQKFEQPPIRERIPQFDAVHRLARRPGVASNLVVVEQKTGAHTGRVPPLMAGPRVESFLPPLTWEIQFGRQSGIENAEARGFVGVMAT